MEQIVCQHCGSVDDFKTELKSNQLTAYCNACGTFIKNLPQGKPKFYIGKYKGCFVHEVDDLKYLQWFSDNIEKKSAALRGALADRISELQLASK